MKLISEGIGGTKDEDEDAPDLVAAGFGNRNDDDSTEITRRVFLTACLPEEMFNRMAA